MLKVEEWLMLRDMALEIEIKTGRVNISEIARQTGYDRKTVRKYLRVETPPQVTKRKNTKSKLDDYKEHIIKQLEGYPALTVVKIYREIQDMGYTGKYTILKDFVREVRPGTAVEAVYRFETKPGIQAQVDWGECGSIEIDGKIRKLYCFSMVLGYSRMRYVEFTLKIDVHTFIQCHINAFGYFGGCTEEILYDNMKQVVIRRVLGPSETKWNSVFNDFARHYGFIPRLCRPYRPQTKGKIENTIGYIKRDFFYGSAFQSFQDINTKAWRWLERVNSSVHGTTHKTPLDLWKEENLKPFDGVSLYRIVPEEKRKISRDCFVSYLGNRYSVPYRYAGRSATVRIEDSTISILVDNKQICEHELLFGSNRVSENKEHFKGLLSEIKKQNNTSARMPRTILRFGDPVVEHRPIASYEKFSEEYYHEQSCI